MKSRDTLVVECFNKEAMSTLSGEPLTTIVTSADEDLSEIVDKYGTSFPEIVFMKAVVHEGDTMDGSILSWRTFYIADNETDLKSIYDIRFDGDYADQERQETFDFYEQKGVSHVFTIAGMRHDLDETSVVLTREGKRLWPAPDNDKPEDTPELREASRLQRQQSLRNYLRPKK